MGKYRVLVTGGAGFIGSNIAEGLLKENEIDRVTVLDNFSTGLKENIDPFFKNPKFQFIEGDIRDYNTCLKASSDVNIVCHQAALGSVPRSIQDPRITNDVNITGTLNVFNAARENNIKKIIYAGSSSTYGDSPSLPKREETIGKPLSPYAVTKYVNELYADVYSKLFDINFIGLRYFNVFGPRQNPEGPYAAVIPLFILSLIKDKAPVIHGDGKQSRDFTYVSNVVQANIKAIFSDDPSAWNQVYNIAYGKQTTLLELYEYIQQVSGKSIQPLFGPERKADVRHSLADISKAKSLLNYNPVNSLPEGLKYTYEWFKEKALIFK